MFDIEQKGDKMSHLYKNYRLPHYLGMGAPSSIPTDVNYNGEKKNNLFVSGTVQIDTVYDSNDWFRSKDVYNISTSTITDTYWFNNYDTFNGNVNSGGMCILAVPMKRIMNGQNYNTTSGYVKSEPLETYETWQYYLISNIQTKIGSKTYSFGEQFVRNEHNVYKQLIKTAINWTDYKESTNLGTPQITKKTVSGLLTIPKIFNPTSGMLYLQGTYQLGTYSSYKNIKYNVIDDSINEIGLNGYNETFGINEKGIVIPTAYILPYSSLWNWTRIRTNLPIFGYDQMEEMYNYFVSGNVDNALNKDEMELLGLDWSTDWKLYIDGKEPSIKLVWESKALETYLDSDKNVSHLTLDDIKIEISQNDVNGNRVSLDYIPYTNGFYKTSYGQLAEKFDMNAWDKFLSNIIGSQTGIGNIPFYFKVFYGTLYSALCYCIIPYSTEPTDYGQVTGFSSVTGINDNSTVTVIYGSDGSEDDGYKDRTEADELPEKGTDGTEGQNTSGLLSSVYVMTETRLKQLASFLWSDDFFQNIKLLNNSPIENIVSCKVMPCSASGTDSPITLGNVSTGVNGDKTSSSMRVQIGSLSIPKYYNSFLDYAPYTKLTIFLPFIGFKELDTNLFMGKTLKLYYVFDFITGAVKAQIFANDIYCMSFDATAGIDIPITASNRAQVEASYIKSALSVGGSIASGNPLVAVGGLLESANAQYHYNTQGTFSPSCGFHDTRLVYVIYDRPTAQYPTTYNHNCGKPCLLTRNLGSVSGYTEVDKGIELSGIPCTESERKEILDLITTGIFL